MIKPVLVGIIVILICVSIIVVNNEHVDYNLLAKKYDNCTWDKERLERLEFFCNKDWVDNKKVIINGMYYAGQGYCVYTKNRTVEDIEETDCHELYHVLVGKDYCHFCNCE